MALLEVILGLGLGFLFIFCALLNWNEMRYRKEGLPPGTMGWPILGESIKFIRQGPDFMKNRTSRYGPLFKSHLLGSPTVVCADPELNRYILMNEKKGFLPGYPKFMMDLWGENTLAALSGPDHKAMKTSILGHVGPSMVRAQLLPKVDQFVRSYLSTWNNKIVDLQKKTKEMAFLLTLKQVANAETSPFDEAIKVEFFQLFIGLSSLPIELPGTKYYRAVKARKKITRMFTEIIEERRSSPSLHRDMLDHLLQSDEGSKAKITNNKVIDLAIAVMYAGYDSVSMTSMMAVKCLHDHPKALEALRDEHLEIRKGKLPEDAVNWSDYKSMNFTRAVIFETLRISSIVSGVLRKTTQDIEMRGFVIPKGWNIFLYLAEINDDPEFLTFNPWKWMDNNSESHQLVFGGGNRLCPGKDLGLAEISTFLHYFVTRYRWEEVGGDVIMKYPRVQAPNGLHIRVWDY